MAACVHKEDEVPTASEQNAAEVMASLGNPLLANRGDLNAVNVTVRTSDELEKIDNGAGEELIWTNPDDPDADIPELEQAFVNKRHGYGWQSDLNVAIRMARRQELPLVVWFHDSVISPASKELGSLYLDTKEFDEWCRNRVVRVRLDSGASLDETGGKSAKYSFHYINNLQRRYGLKKKPAVAIITPSGKIVARLDGYDGFLATFVQEMKEGVARAEQTYREYKQKFVERGFRDWHSLHGGHTVFAKIMRIDEKADVVYLKEPGGRVTRTKIRTFCEEDEQYLRSLFKTKPEQKPVEGDEDEYEQI